MIIEIEYYKGDTILSGKNISLNELKQQIDFIESVCDRETDNFIDMMLRVFNWNILYGYSGKIDFVYDRDTDNIIKKES